jgi:hypothetical protein
MFWSGRRLLGILRATVAVCVLGFVVGPEFVFQKLDESLLVTWKAVGDSIFRHHLASLSRRLDEERELVGRMRMRRDALTTRLRGLELRSFWVTRLRRCHSESSVVIVDPPWGGGDYARGFAPPPQPYPEDKGELVRTERAFRSITTEIERVDGQIEAAERALQVNERDLFVLEATAEARQIRQELAGAGDPRSWSARAGYLLELLLPISAASSD